MRLQANTLVLNTYRNGPIEDLHGGMWSLGDQTPGFARLYAPEVTRVARKMTERMAVELGMFDRPSPEATVKYTVLRAPHDWKRPMEETSFSAYRGVPGGPPLAARIKELAIRYPTAYGPTMRESSYDMYQDRLEPAGSEPADVAVLLDATARLREMRRELGKSAPAGAG